MQELVVVVFIEPFEFGQLERIGQVLEGLLVEEPKHPLVEDELLGGTSSGASSGKSCGDTARGPSGAITGSPAS